MSQDQSPAVIDATDAQVLPREDTAPILTERQTEELDKCQHHLQQLGGKIGKRESDLKYLYAEAGWWLLRAKEVHRCDTMSPRSAGRFVEQRETGFLRWLETQNLGITERTAQRWMQWARNCGLTAESNLLALDVLKAERKLDGVPLLGGGRKPVDKTAKEFTPAAPWSVEEVFAAQELDILEFYTDWAARTTEHMIEAQNWADMGYRKREALCGIAYEAYRLLKESLKRDDLSRKNPQAKPSEQSTRSTPRPDYAPLPRFEKRKKGERWWWGYLEPQGKAIFRPYKGDKQAMEEAGKTMPGVVVVGPFKASSERYAREKVKQLTADAEALKSPR